MEYLICPDCGADLISTERNVWLCPSCGKKYDVDEESIREVGVRGEDLVTKRISYSKPSTATPQTAFIYYILTVIFPPIGIILGISLWNKDGMRSVARNCFIIGGAITIINIVFFLVILIFTLILQ